jgi:6,7-dimethyl-8-ribityllumazine synthase
MLRAHRTKSALNARGLRFGIAAARYNTELADSLLSNCVDTLLKAGASKTGIQVIRVPGSFEVSAAAGYLAKSGKCDCVIALGILLEGETRHAEHIGNAVATGLTQIAIETGVPTVFGVVTANTLQQARVRCLSKNYNRGREAAATGIEMARLWKTL